MEQVEGFEPSTICLASKHSDQTELHLHNMADQIGVEPTSFQLPLTSFVAMGDTDPFLNWSDIKDLNL